MAASRQAQDKFEVDQGIIVGALECLWPRKFRTENLFRFENNLNFKFQTFFLGLSKAFSHTLVTQNLLVTFHFDSHFAFLEWVISKESTHIEAKELKDLSQSITMSLISFDPNMPFVMIPIFEPPFIAPPFQPPPFLHTFPECDMVLPNHPRIREPPREPPRKLFIPSSRRGNFSRRLHPGPESKKKEKNDKVSKEESVNFIGNELRQDKSPKLTEKNRVDYQLSAFASDFVPRGSSQKKSQSKFDCFRKEGHPKSTIPSTESIQNDKNDSKRKGVSVQTPNPKLRASACSFIPRGTSKKNLEGAPSAQNVVRSQKDKSAPERNLTESKILLDGPKKIFTISKLIQRPDKDLSASAPSFSSDSPSHNPPEKASDSDSKKNELKGQIGTYEAFQRNLVKAFPSEKTQGEEMRSQQKSETPKQQLSAQANEFLPNKFEQCEKKVETECREDNVKAQKDTGKKEAESRINDIGNAEPKQNWNVSASEFVPGGMTQQSKALHSEIAPSKSKFNASASEFVPKGVTQSEVPATPQFSAQAPEFVPQASSQHGASTSQVNICPSIIISRQSFHFLI